MSETEPSPRNRLARKLVIDLSIMTVIGVVLALIGPFGSFEEPVVYRLAAWLSFSYLGYAIYSPMAAVVARAQTALDLPAPGLWVAAVLVATIPMAIAVWSIRYLPGPIRTPDFEQAAATYFYVLVIGGGVTALFYALETRAGKVQPSSEPAAALSPDGDGHEARFLERLPPQLGQDLVALEMEDHYVRAHTALGSDLILLRMRDAVTELDGLDGAQVHRSWWVARDAVTGTRREGRNLRLQLTGGLEAPVSRNAVPTLKQAGWL